jgi:maltose/moltooligosaccharide transporter
MRQRLAYLGCSFGTGVFSAFNNFTLTLWLAAFTDSYLVLGLLGNSRAFVGALVSPAVGGWSDRVWLGWLGRRRPFILAGTVVAGLGMALTPQVAGSLGPIVVVILLYTAWYNAADDIHQALLVDITSERERNRLAARSVVVHFAGQVAILLLGFAVWSEAVPDWAFSFTGALLVLGALVTVLGVKETNRAPREPPTPCPPPSYHGASRLRRLSTAPQAGEGEQTRDWPAVSPFPAAGRGGGGYSGALVFGLVYFCYWSGVNAVMPLVSVYTQHILGASVGEAQLLPALLLISTTVMALPMGWLGDRYGRKRVMTAGYAIVGLCGLAGLVITTKEQGAVVFLLAGVGNAASMVLTIPLLAELVPGPRIGAATGLLAASGSVAAPLASLAAGALSDLYGPRAIFGLMAVMIALALALMPAVRRSTPVMAEKC